MTLTDSFVAQIESISSPVFSTAKATHRRFLTNILHTTLDTAQTKAQYPKSGL